MAADFKGDVMFVLVTTDEAEHKRVIDFFGINEEVLFTSWPVLKYNSYNQYNHDDEQNQELPTMRITASEEDMVKFKPEDASLTEANMRAVLKQFKVFPHEFNDDGDDGDDGDEDDDDVDEDNGDDVD